MCNIRKAGRLAFFFIFYILTINLTQAAISQIERDALISLYNATAGDSWTNRTNWKTEADFSAVGTECTWHGVSCSGDTVSTLQLDSNNLVGIIPVELGNLTNLKRLYLNNNQLSSSIPKELGSLTKLITLILFNNNLSGAIPSELGNLTNLDYFSLQNNKLTGTIPASLGNLTKLTTLFLNNNQLSGAIPAELGKLTSLQALILSDNGLNGTIPAELGTLTNITTLTLFNNSLSGNIPVELGDLSSLQSLFLYDNQLNGAIPPELGKLTNLKALMLHNNKLSEAIPSELGNLVQLQNLYLYNNYLSGAIPDTLGNLSELQTFYLYDNLLSGNIPTQLGNLTKLKRLYLQDNLLTGTVPTQLGNMLNLQYLYLRGNKLNGELPGSLINLTLLNSIDLRYNALYSSDSTLLSYLDSKHLGGNILSTQTLDAIDLGRLNKTETSIILNWDIVTFTQFGGYRIYLSSDGGVNYALVEDITSKFSTSKTLTGLAACTAYHIKVHSYTKLHSGNSNEVESDGNNGEVLNTYSDCIPTITEGLGQFSLAENVATNTSVTSIVVNDPDGDTLNYSLTAGNDSGIFAINSSTGTLTVANPLDYESTAQYILTVSVSDGVNTVNGIVTVDITDVDEAPSLTGGTGTFSKPENVTVGNIVTTLTAVDPDGGSVTYSITAGNDSGSFAVNNSTGVLTVAKPLDYETTSSYALSVSVSDGVHNTTGTVTVNITNINDSTPVFTNGPGTFTLAEDVLANMPVTTLVASDPDGDTLTYNITAGNSSGTFELNSSTGAITTTKPLDYETTSSYALTVSVSDGIHTTADTVTVNITNINDNSPVITAGLGTYSQSEDAELGNSVTTLAANDPDALPLSYTITAGNDNGTFAINSNTGEITIAKTLDYETTNNYNLTVNVSDGIYNVSGNIIINIINTNDNIPQFTDGLGVFSLAENVALGNVVTSLNVVDADGDTLSYNLTSENNNGTFTLNSSTGVLTVTGPLDYETIKSYTLTVMVSDGVNSTEGEVNVNVTDIDEAPPPSGSGGGCSLKPGAPFDPVWLFMLGVMIWYRLRRQHQRSVLH